jgi:hypothetical protein
VGIEEAVFRQDLTIRELQEDVRRLRAQLRECGEAYDVLLEQIPEGPMKEAFAGDGKLAKLRSQT